MNRGRRARLLALAGLAFCLEPRAARAGDADLALPPIAIDAPTQARCATAAASRDRFAITIDSKAYAWLGDYPPQNDAIYFLPDTPYFHALWIEGLARYFASHGLTPDAGPLARSCTFSATARPGGLLRSTPLPSGTYIMVILVRSAADVAEVDGGFIRIAPRPASAAAPSARFFAREIDIEGSGSASSATTLLVDDVP